MAHGPDSYEQRPPQPLTPELAAEFERRRAAIREAFSTLPEITMGDYRSLGYIEGLGDGLAFGLRGTLDANHLLTLRGYELDFGLVVGVPAAEAPQ